jgi:hypothetical protein
MTLPILKLVSTTFQKTHGSLKKAVIWTALGLAYFGSFPTGELVSPEHHAFSKDTLLRKDVVFKQDSVTINEKTPKSKKVGGETIEVYEFKGHGCCPIKALKKLVNLCHFHVNMPVFSFSHTMSIDKNFSLL